MEKWENKNNDEESDSDWEEGYEREYIEEPNIFGNEINAFERVGAPELIGLTLSTFVEGKLGKINDKLNILSRTDNEAFSFKVAAIAKNFNINYNEINSILTEIYKIKNIKYKNPTAFVVGYLVTRGGKKINKNEITKLIKNKNLIESNIKGPDILRYARFWINL
tara:strand:+ start:202 stop:696 length:495 start_codon:yes stop_codon:yes gene_type:complete